MPRFPTFGFGGTPHLFSPLRLGLSPSRSGAFLASKLVRKALKYRALLVIDDMTEESRRELLEEGLPRDVIKLLMSNLKRFVHQLETLAQWYGVPYEFKRLYSKKCPICGYDLTQLPGRTMVCENCRFKAPRDLVPMYWALRKYNC